uniref:Uncharacterized protein n=1 Tax=Plectus sambesii TaxID=2011161 RepID=A0A914X9E0_9BILA
MELNAAEALLYELSKQTKTQQRLAIYDRLVNIEDDEVDLYESLAKLASAWIPSTIDDAIGPEGEVRVKAVLLLGLLVDDPNYVAQNTVASLLRDITKKVII